MLTYRLHSRMNIKNIVTTENPCVTSIQMVTIYSTIEALRFTFPSTTQQSLIMYRVGALSVASTIISYLTNSHNQKKSHGFSGNIHKGNKKSKHGRKQASRKKKDQSRYGKENYLLRISRALEVRKASSCSTTSIEELTLNIHKNLVATTVIHNCYKHLSQNEQDKL